MAAVDFVRDEDDAPLEILERVAREMVKLLGFDAIPVGHELKERGSAGKTGGGEDEVSLDDRRWDLRRAAGRSVVAPEELSGRRVDADEPHFLAAGQRHVLPNAAGLGDHRSTNGPPRPRRESMKSRRPRPVCFLSATIVAWSAPGQQTILSPSIKGDSL